MSARAPLPTLRRSGREHFLKLLDESIGNLLDGRPNLAFANLTHAIQVLHGLDDRGPGAVPLEVKARLDAIIRLGGGIR